MTQLELGFNSIHALLEEGNITLQGCMAQCTAVLSNPLHEASAELSHTHMHVGIQHDGHAQRTLTDESVSILPLLSLTRNYTSRPA
jgi:hypothetical protein